MKAFDVRLPEAYRSTDFKTFEGLSKIILSEAKFDIDRLTRLNDSEHCPEHLLSLLCNKIGMPYFTNAIPAVNRQILRCWRWMIKNKGSQPAIKLMSSLAMMSFVENAEDISTIIYYTNTVDVYLRTFKTLESGESFENYTRIRNYIQIFYETIPGFTNSEIEDRILEYINYVRPASWRVVFQPAVIQREGGVGKGLVIDSREQNITQTEEPYTIGHAKIMEEPDENRRESGVDFSEVWDINNAEIQE